MPLNPDRRREHRQRRRLDRDGERAAHDRDRLGVRLPVRGLDAAAGHDVQAERAEVALVHARAVERVRRVVESFGDDGLTLTTLDDSDSSEIVLHGTILGGNANIGALEPVRDRFESGENRSEDYLAMRCVCDQRL